MAKRIKGVTVEINGDVTGLDKALREVDKQSRDVGSDLKEINKLLKLDPSNVTLLEQKQRALAQSAELTRNRYEAVKKALDGVTGSNIKWEQWTKEQERFTQQTTKTENELRALLDRQKQLKEIGFDPKSAEWKELQGEIDKTTAKLEEIRQESERTYEQLGRPVSVETYDELQRELIKSEQAMKEAEKASDGFNVALESTAAKLKGVSEASAKAAEATKGLSIAGGVVAASLAGLAIKAGQSADEINTLARNSGFSTEAIQSWQYAADRIDVDVNTIISAAGKMKKNMVSESADVQEAWARLAVSTRTWTGELRDSEDVFDDTVRALSMIENETERDIVSMTIFGKSADELSGIIDDGGEALRGYQQEAKDLGLILSDEALAGANAFNDGLDRLKAQAQASFFSAGSSLAENLLPMLERLVEIGGTVLEWFAGLDGSVLRVILTIGILVATISPVLKLISGISGAIGSITSVAGTFISMAGDPVYATFLKWAAIIVAVTAAITLLVVAISALTGKSSELNSSFASMRQATGLNSLTSGGSPYMAGQQAMSYSPAVQQSAAGYASQLNTASSSTVINITEQIDGQTLARNQYTYNQAEGIRHGAAAVS